MTTNSTIINDQDIQDAKNNIRALNDLKPEIEMAIKAGVNPSATIKDIDAKIDKLRQFIKVYSGENFTV